MVKSLHTDDCSKYYRLSNSFRDTLGEQDRALVLGKILECLIHAVNVGDSRMVIKKLCGAAVAYYLRPSSEWKMCIRHIANCFKERRVVPNPSVAEQPAVSSTIVVLNSAQLLAVLWISQILVEEMEKATADTMHLYYTCLSSNDLLLLIIIR